MSPWFDSAFEIVIGLEGNYSNDPNDPGGETRWGVSKRAYPNIDIAKLTLDEAKAIYRRDYWDRCGCDGYSWEMALITFDTAVNQGLFVEHTLHTTTTDAVEFMAERALRYVERGTFERYGRGWFRRLFKIMKLAQRTP